MSNQHQPGPMDPQPGVPRMLQPGTGRSKAAPATALRILGAMALVIGAVLFVFGVVNLVRYLVDDVHEQRFSESARVVLEGEEERTVWVDGPPADDEGDEYPPADTCRVLGPDQQPVSLSTKPRSRMTINDVTSRTVGTFRAGPSGGEYTIECDGHEGKLTDPPEVGSLIAAAFSTVGGFLLILWSVFLFSRARRRSR